MNRPRSQTRPADSSSAFAAVAVLLAGGLAVLVPLTGGAYRDDHFAGLGVLLGLAMLVFLAEERAPRGNVSALLAVPRFQALVAGIAVFLTSSSLFALASPIRDAATSVWTGNAILAAAFLVGLLLGASRGAGARLFADCAVGGLALLGALSIVHGLGPGDDLRSGLAWPFENHAQLGGLLATGAVLAFTAAQPRRRRPGDPRYRLPDAPSMLRLGMAAFLIVTAAASQSRSAFLALAAVMIVSVVPRRLGAAALVVAVLAGAVFWVGAGGRWDPEQVSGSGPVRDRVAVWSASLALFGDRPWTGSGLGSYGSAIWRYTPEEVGGAITHAHSRPLELLAERGLLGFLPLLLLGALFARASRWPAGSDAGESRTLSRGFLLAGVVLPVQACVDVVLENTGTAALSAALLGLAAGPPLARRASASIRTTSLRARAFLAGVAGLTLIASGSWGWRTADRARAQASHERGDPDGARRWAERSVDRFPADRVSLRRLAEAGDLKRFEELARLDRDDPFAALGAAAFHETEGRTERAEEELRRAAALFPDGYAPRRSLLEFFARHGRLAEALEEARAIGARHPGRAVDAALWLAEYLDNPLLAEAFAPGLGPERDADRRRIYEWLLGRDHPHAALRLLASVGDEEARTPGHLLSLARAQAAAGELGRAREALRAASAAGDSGAAAILLADLAVEPHDLGEAEAALRTAMSGKHPTPGTAGRLLSILDRQGRAGEADRWLDDEIRNRPGEAPLLELRLQRRTRSGDLSGAMSDARDLIRRKPHDPGGRLALARLYERRGMRSGALQLYREALEMAPENAEARGALVRLGGAEGIR